MRGGALWGWGRWWEGVVAEVNCLFIAYSIICPQGELGEAECEQALSTLFHVLFTMARMMVCGGGRGEGYMGVGWRGRGTCVWSGEGGAHVCGVEGEGHMGVWRRGGAYGCGVEGEGHMGVWRRGGAHGCGLEREGHMGVGWRGRGTWVCGEREGLMSTMGME